MAPNQNAGRNNIPVPDSKHLSDGMEQERRISAVSEIQSQEDDDSISLISGYYETNSDVDKTDTIIQRSSPTKVTTLRQTRPEAPIQARYGEVQRRGLDAIQPVQRTEAPAKSAVSLRLDLNLDVEVNLKAKIRGDLTLTLL
ncbi:uncharacterized protein N7482_005356 [Penicillium canariense]|uniref:Uncharacterized protein n=1 Tax=Penicillium canariense TaxID=189055 RepID=A0A9W9I292_9EURO|nr:uncharacterized protein N7482_005356 [Penicillium canariense]KAJ5166575.1 hypothetical protein N7482_005356 [Penicillium canariense]